MRKIEAFKVISLSFLVIWCVIIFMFSAQNAENSSNTSGTVVTKIVESVYPEYKTLSNEKQENIVKTVTVIVRKTAHFLEYFILGVLSFFTFTAFIQPKLKWHSFLPVIFCVLYSISDELHQYFVPGRACRALDVLIDSMGSLAAVFLLAVITQKIEICD